jgi:hypothetical protein
LAPKFLILSPEESTCIGPPSFFHFICVEILKNSVAALVRKWGLMDLDVSPPVEIRVDTKQNYLYIR